ncbi:MAG: DUF4118 domain-containing protein [Acidimicrobiales bacterium]
MNAFRGYRSRWAVVAALVAPLVLAAVLVPFRGSFANSAAALALIALVAAVAVAGNRFAGVLASLSSALWFDFFLTRPYDRLVISHRNDIETTVSILIVGVIVTELAARSRHHFKAANEGSNYVEMIHGLALLAAGTEPIEGVVERAVATLRELLELRDCRFEHELVEPPLARIGTDGEVLHVGLLWPVENIGIPGPEAEILAQWRGRVMGRFVLTPTPGQPVPLERRVVALSLAELVGAALYERRPVA